jgi:hypothetical protein
MLDVDWGCIYSDKAKNMLYVPSNLITFGNSTDWFFS